MRFSEEPTRERGMQGVPCSLLPRATFLPWVGAYFDNLARQ